MTVDFTGIYNENEFYTSHYLTALLETTSKILSKTGTAKRKGIKTYARLALVRSIFRCAAA